MRSRWRVALGGTATPLVSENDSSEVEIVPSGKDKGKGRADPLPEGSKDSGDQVCAGLS